MGTCIDLFRLANDSGGC